MSRPNASAADVLDKVFLEVRCKLLDAAACLDRIERSEGADNARKDPRHRGIQEAIAILASTGTDRAERIQLLFSDSYVDNWLSAVKQGQPGPSMAGKAFQESV